MGHVYEQQREYELAKGAYERVLMEKPDDAKVLQQFGWLFAQPNTSFTNEQTAIEYLTRSLKADSNDAQSWYLLGRCYIAQQNYHKAYEAYQQAVYRDARNPAFWCSIGVLYYQINQVTIIIIIIIPSPKPAWRNNRLTRQTYTASRCFGCL